MHFFLCGCTAKHPYCILSSLFSFFHCFLQWLLPLLGLGALQKKKHVSYVGLHHCICGITHRWTRLPCVLPKNWLILLTTFLLKLQVIKNSKIQWKTKHHISRGATSQNRLRQVKQSRALLAGFAALQFCTSFFLSWKQPQWTHTHITAWWDNQRTIIINGHLHVVHCALKAWFYIYTGMGTGGCVAMSDCQKALCASSFLLFITSINEVSFSALNLRRTMRRRSWYPQQIAALQHLESVPEIWWPTFSEVPPPSHHLSAGQVGRNAWPEISGRAASNGIWSTLNATHRLLSQISQLFFSSSFKLGKNTREKRSSTLSSFFTYSHQKDYWATLIMS